ncbi:MAG: hypothetical protein FWE90_13160 [Defluviitaleaceae bacterium]|nr:hypothetical protein [Defluviitaleaceae bacterium]
MFDIWVRLVENSAVMSVAIVIMYGLSRLTRDKTSPRVRYICWIVITVGLLLPVRPVLFTVNVPESVAWMVPAESLGRMPEDPVPEGAIIINAYEAAGWEYECGEATDTAYAYIGADVAYETVHMTGLAAAPTEDYIRTVNWRTLLPVVWGAGILLFLLTYTVRHIRFIRKIRRWAVPCTDAGVISLLNGVCREVNLKRIPRLFVCSLTATPIITGLFRSSLILPDDGEPPERLRLIFLHEVLHIKRGDLWVRMLTLAAMAAHWFNPLAYLMNRAVHNEAELCCDKQVLRIAGDDVRAAYGQTIFCTARRTQKMFSVLATALSGEGKNLKRRLADIIERKHTRRGLAIAFAALMIGGVLIAGMLAYEGEVPVPEGGFVEDIGWLGDGVTLDVDPDRYAPEPTDAADPSPPLVANPITLEASDELVIYLPAYRFFNPQFQVAVNIFRRRYPNVTVIVEHIGDPDDFRGNAYAQRVSTELMAGTGPDIILTHYFDDIHKTMDSGLFMNLSPLWHRDENFDHRDSLHPVVMDAGVYRGRRYIIPLSYIMPTVLGEKGMLENAGFDTEAERDIVSFLNAVSSSVPLASQNPLFRLPIFNYGLHNFNMTGIPIVDFERGIALPEEGALRAHSEAMKTLWATQSVGIDWNETFWSASNTDTLLIHGRMLLSHNQTQDPIGVFWSYSRLLHRGYTPILTALRNHNNEIHATVRQSVAIRAESPNYANAWNFIKILLSEEVMYGRIGSVEGSAFHGFVVNNAAVERQVEGILRNGQEVGTAEGNVFINALTMEHKQPMLDMVNDIASASLRNNVLGNFYLEAMEPFFEGLQSLDDTIEELGRRLRIYLTE